MPVCEGAGLRNGQKRYVVELNSPTQQPKSEGGHCRVQWYFYVPTEDGTIP